MSIYSFIATDYEIPEVKNSKERIITVQEAIELRIKAYKFMPWEKMKPDDKIIFYEKESDLDELVIEKGTKFEKNVRWYTHKPFIYSIYFQYSELRAKQLLEYLKENIREGQQLELWLIWLDDKQSIKPNVIKYEELSIHELKQLYHSKDKKYVHHNCIIVER